MKDKLGKMWRNATMVYKGQVLRNPDSTHIYYCYCFHFMFEVKYSYIIQVVSTLMFAVIVVGNCDFDYANLYLEAKVPLAWTEVMSS